MKRQSLGTDCEGIVKAGKSGFRNAPVKKARIAAGLFVSLRFYCEPEN
jgi:hypothetical protein